MHHHGMRSLLPLALVLGACASSPQRGEERGFQARNEIAIDVPEGTKELRAWIALPAEDEPLQEVRNLDVQVDAPAPAKVTKKEVIDEEGNRFLAVTARDAGGEKLRVTTTFDLARWEAKTELDPAGTHALAEDQSQELAHWLEEDTNVVATPEIRAAAAEVVGDERNPVVEARLLYGRTLGPVQVWV